MRECERFAQVAQDIWATVSESLWSLMTNERMWAIRSGHSGQMSEWANLLFFLRKLLIFSFAHQKWAIRSKIVFYVRFYSFFLCLKKQKICFAHSFWAKWVNCSGRSGQMSDRERFAQVAQKE